MENISKIVSNTLMKMAYSEYNRVKLSYYDKNTGKFFSPIQLISEELSEFTPSLKGLFIYNDFVVSIRPKMKHEPKVNISVTEEVKSRWFGLKTSVTKTEIQPKLSYSKIKHYIQIQSPYMTIPEIEMETEYFKDLVKFFEDNFSGIDSERFVIDDLNQSEEIQRFKEVFNV